MLRRLAEHFSVPASELPARPDNHLVRVDVSYPERFSADGLARVEIGLTALNPVPPEVWIPFGCERASAIN